MTFRTFLSTLALSALLASAATDTKITTSTSTLAFYDNTAQGGTINQSRKNDTILTFQVKKTIEDEQNNQTITYTCLKVQFALDVVLKPLGLNQTMTAKTTLSNQFSSCDTLMLNFERPDSKIADDNGASIKLKFSIEQSEKNDADVQIFYLENLQAEKLNFTGNLADVTMPFMKEGAPLPDDAIKYQSTPIEANLQESFKCYFGFTKTANNTSPTLDKNTAQQVEFNFSKFRMQMFDQNQANTDSWKPTLSCDSDVSKVLPIIVGVVLASIVVFTLVGYVIARKRSRHAYEEL